jgi:hypothetical protein
MDVCAVMRCYLFAINIGIFPHFNSKTPKLHKRAETLNWLLKEVETSIFRV